MIECINPRCQQIERLLKTLVIHTGNSINSDRETWTAIGEAQELFGVKAPRQKKPRKPRRKKVEKFAKEWERIEP